jgi:thiamine transport system ATP-binding protein
VLRLDAVTFQNGSFRLAADLNVAKRRKVAVMGPSGSGKSTLVNGVAGFHEAITGRLFWDGAEITAMAPGKRPVAMLFQDGNLFPHLSVRQNAALGVRPDLKLSVGDWTRVDAALAEVGLGDLGARKPAELSGGQQSRAALARVLSQARPILILDEPFAALGPALKHEMLDLVERLVEETGATLLMVTHDPGDATRIADDIILVEGGQAHPPSSATKMLANPSPALRAYLG